MKILGGLLLALALPVHAADLEVGIGASLYKDRGDGYWVQEAFQHKMDLGGQAFTMGVTGDVAQYGDIGLAWHLAYVRLGTVHTQSMATPSDANYNARTKGCNGKCWPLANYVGTGNDQGIYFTLQPYWETQGWRFGIEAGPYLHKSRWNEDVQGWRPTENGQPLDLHVHNENRWAVGKVLGVSVSHKNLTLSFQYFKNADRVLDHDTYGAVWGSTKTVMLKYQF